MSTPRFCVDCLHFRSSDQGFHTCEFIYPGEFDLVTGHGLKQEYAYCSTLRKAGAPPRLCGPQGQYFVEAKVQARDFT